MVDPREIEQMAKLRRIMEGEIPQPDSDDVDGNNVLSPKEDMKEILNRLYNSSVESIDRVKEKTTHYPELRSAITTNKTQDGVVMGSWEIKEHQDSTGKMYDVVNIHTNEPIAHDISLYDAAMAIAKLLNFYVGINSIQIREILDLEAEYTKHRQDAAIFKRRAKERMAQDDQFRASISEDRFNESRARAIAIRDKLKSIAEKL